MPSRAALDQPASDAPRAEDGLLGRARGVSQGKFGIRIEDIVVVTGESRCYRPGSRLIVTMSVA
jgi:hypothetical protein